MNELKYIPGDLVIYTSLIKDHIAEICEVYETSYLIGFKRRNSAIVTSKEIKPIPLTSDILKKNGWEFRRGFCFSPNEEGILICLISQGGGVWDAYTGGKPLRSDINNVSDLQHLLFGLGINHEMEV